MKRLVYLWLAVLVVSLLLPMTPVCAQAPAKKSLPQVPITYPGDTDKTIIRRAQWVEGAKKEGSLAWWGSDMPKEVNQMTVEFNKVYPFIKVDYWRGGEGEGVSRIEAEHSIGRLTVDICDVGEGGWGVEKTEDFLRKLRQQQPIWVAGHSGGRSLMVAGEFKIMGANFLRYFFQSQGKADPLGWSKVNPIPITGGIFLLAKKAPHPNAARLFIEWMFSPPGLALYEKVTGPGAASPGSGTILSKALEGLPLVYRTEEVLMKVTEMKLDKKLAEIVGATPE